MTSRKAMFYNPVPQNSVRGLHLQVKPVHGAVQLLFADAWACWCTKVHLQSTPTCIMLSNPALLAGLEQGGFEGYPLLEKKPATTSFFSVCHDIVVQILVIKTIN